MPLAISPTAFVTFLISAKRQTYASQGDNAPVAPLVLGSRQLEYQEGVLLYRDIYDFLLRMGTNLCTPGLWDCPKGEQLLDTCEREPQLRGL